MYYTEFELGYLKFVHQVVLIGFAHGLTHPYEWLVQVWRTGPTRLPDAWYEEVRKYIPKFLYEITEHDCLKPPESAKEILDAVNSFYAKNSFIQGIFDPFNDEIQAYVDSQKGFKPSKERPCGNPECSISSNIAEILSFGSGDLDPNGFWEFPCAICAADYKRKHPLEDVWPDPSDPQKFVSLRAEITVEYDVNPEWEHKTDDIAEIIRLESNKRLHDLLNKYGAKITHTIKEVKENAGNLPSSKEG